MRQCSWLLVAAWAVGILAQSSASPIPQPYCLRALGETSGTPWKRYHLFGNGLTPPVQVVVEDPARPCLRITQRVEPMTVRHNWICLSGDREVQPSLVKDVILPFGIKRNWPVPATEAESMSGGWVARTVGYGPEVELFRREQPWKAVYRHFFLLMRTDTQPRTTVHPALAEDYFSPGEHPLRLEFDPDEKSLLAWNLDGYEVRGIENARVRARYLTRPGDTLEWAGFIDGAPASISAAGGFEISGVIVHRFAPAPGGRTKFNYFVMNLQGKTVIVRLVSGPLTTLELIDAKSFRRLGSVELGHAQDASVGILGYDRSGIVVSGDDAGSYLVNRLR